MTPQSSIAQRVRIDSIAGKSCLTHVFKGHLTKAEAQEHLRQQRLRMKSLGRPVIFVWDCREMSSYESAARLLWQAELSALRGEIREAWVVSGSQLIRMGASMLGMFGHFPIHTCSTMEDVLRRND